MRRLIIAVSVLLLSLFALTSPALDRPTAAARQALPRLQPALASAHVEPGAAVFIRIFKRERELELWMRKGDAYVAVKRYPICTYSGTLGPKQRTGDGQAPEGFYSVRRGQLNPYSSYHLSFDLGYPNAYDRALGRTGRYLMVHGNCVSIGCYAMGDEAIEEIYTLMAAAYDAGQGTIAVHVFPFRFDKVDQTRYAKSQWAGFWGELRNGFQRFEETTLPPKIEVQGQHYVVID